MAFHTLVSEDAIAAKKRLQELLNSRFKLLFLRTGLVYDTESEDETEAMIDNLLEIVEKEWHQPIVPRKDGVYPTWIE